MNYSNNMNYQNNMNYSEEYLGRSGGRDGGQYFCSPGNEGSCSFIEEGISFMRGKGLPWPLFIYAMVVFICMIWCLIGYKLPNNVRWFSVIFSTITLCLFSTLIAIVWYKGRKEAAWISSTVGTALYLTYFIAVIIPIYV